MDKISQIDKDSDETVECISELTEYVLCLSNLLYMIVKIQIKINMFEYNICQAKPNVTIDNLALIVIKKFYDLVSEIKNSMYEYYIRIPDKHLYVNSYTSSNKVNIKNTYEEIMEQINRIMGDVSVNKDVYERPFSERFISCIEVWRKET